MTNTSNAIIINIYLYMISEVITWNSKHPWYSPGGELCPFCPGNEVTHTENLINITRQRRIGCKRGFAYCESNIYIAGQRWKILSRWDMNSKCCVDDIPLHTLWNLTPLIWCGGTEFLIYLKCTDFGIVISPWTGEPGYLNKLRLKMWPQMTH